ncbi:MAG: hypothetical protein N2F24_12820 [Deltaproteobacteria bacterium]
MKNWKLKIVQISSISIWLLSSISSEAYGGRRVQTCPSNYVVVPGDIDYRMRKFCVMKYEAKCGLLTGSGCTAQAASRKPVSQKYGTPWVSISQQDSKTECASIGKGHHLITNDEWMAVAANAAENAANWCTAGGASCGTQGASITASQVSTGSLVLSRGHADNSPTSACDGQYESV